MHIWFVFHGAPTTINNFKLELCFKAQLGQVLMLFRVHRRLFIAILSATETQLRMCTPVGGSCLVTDAYVRGDLVVGWWCICTACLHECEKEIRGEGNVRQMVVSKKTCHTFAVERVDGKKSVAAVPICRSTLMCVSVNYRLTSETLV